MSLGTSIFLAAVLLAGVALFIATKDRWNWKKIALWPAGVLASLAVLIGLGVWFYTLITERPQAQSVFWDIPIDATKGDVKFLKGEPTRIEDKEEWDYFFPKSEITESSLYVIHFKGDKLRSIGYSGPILSAPDIQGLYIGATQEAVTNKFGTPSHMSVSHDDLAKLLSFQKYNVYFVLSKNKVDAFGMFNPEYGPMRFGKEMSAKDKK